MNRMISLKFGALAIFFFAALLPAQAVDIQTVKSDNGVTALLVEDYTVPLISMSFSFAGGTTQDADGKEGAANLLTTLLDEGAGEIKSQAFQNLLDDVGVEYSFGAQRDYFTGRMRTVKDNASESFNLMAMMLNKPRFDEEPVGRMKASLLAGLRQAETDPGAISSKTLRATAFAGHLYGREPKGTIETLGALTPADARDYYSRIFARDNLVIGVVGAISAEELKPVLDQLFGALPAKATLRNVPELQVVAGKDVHVELAVPQTNITMALPGIKRSDPDFYAGYLVNYVLGGGAFSSRLYNEVREKRGLAYGVYSYLGTFENGGIVGAGSATGAASAGKTIDIMRSEMKRIAEEGPTADELEKAKKYIKGSYAIANLDTSGKIASVLVAIQQANLGLDYIDKRADYIGAVTLEDAKRVAKKLFSTVPTMVTVGQMSK